MGHPTCRCRPFPRFWQIGFRLQGLAVSFDVSSAWERGEGERERERERRPPWAECKQDRLLLRALALESPDTRRAINLEDLWPTSNGTGSPFALWIGAGTWAIGLEFRASTKRGLRSVIDSLSHVSAGQLSASACVRCCCYELFTASRRLPSLHLSW